MFNSCRWLAAALLLLAMFSFTGYAQVEKFSMVEIQVAPEKLANLYALGLPLDCCEHTVANGTHRYVVPLQQHDIQALQDSRFTFKVTVDDAAAFYAKNTEDPAKIEELRKTFRTEMQLGSLKGAYKVAEAWQTLDKLYKKYSDKNLMTEKVVIGRTYENREIYMVKISDNASTDETGEPQALYTALTHAREPGGMMALFYFMYYLLENYETNQRVRSIVDNHELYFIPIVNVDGYYYNEKNYPNGGGMWRKSRKSSGTDLNRNYGPQELWNYPNGGSSTSSSSDTYRGTAPFSEPETQVVRDFVTGKRFRTALNYHTYSNLLIYPWGYEDKIANPKFKTMAIAMTSQNGYSYGTAEGLLYAVRGVSDDWFFKEHNIFAMTPEVGGSSDGFWPAASRYMTLAQENLEANLLLAEYSDQVKMAESK
jgi:hypothetical protein